MTEKARVIKFEDADPAIQQLARESLSAREKAYAPFSEFKVGAALLCKDNTVFRGCNVENSMYGATICAERTACTKAVSEGYQQYEAVAVCADKALDQFTTPCGFCRQFLFEFAPDLPVYCVPPDLKEIFVSSLTELIPYGFRLNPTAVKKPSY